jgi:hypothetical protein
MTVVQEGGVEVFLRAAGWGGAVLSALAGDASARRYGRLVRADGATAILMQAPVSDAAEQGSLAAFLRVGGHLRALGLSAPEVWKVDPAAGLVLIEDLGDATLARLLRGDPDMAREAYGVMAGEVLPHLARAPLPDWAARPDAGAQAGMIDLTLGMLPDPGGVADLRPVLEGALVRLCPGPPVLALRDCHGDNLIWLPGREGSARVGLLDHQDAVALPLGYDLASMVDDPRRDLPEGWREALIAEFAKAMDLPVEEVGARVAVLSLLRNLRILGIFHRLASALGKPAYRAFLPRTGALIDRAVAHPALSDLRAPVAHLRRQTEGWA